MHCYYLKFNCVKQLLNYKDNFSFESDSESVFFSTLNCTFTEHTMYVGTADSSVVFVTNICILGILTIR